MDKMNPYLNNHDVLNQIMMSLLLDGNAYVATVRNEAGQVVQLTPLDPTTITPKLKMVNVHSLPRTLLTLYSRKMTLLISRV